MKLIDRGLINLYAYAYSATTPGYTSTNGTSSGRITKTEIDYYIEQEDKFSLVTKIEFRKVLLPYISDNISLADKVKDRTFKYKDLRYIVKKYNANAD